MRLHLVDGTYELFRAYYGAPKRSAPDGREVGATLGLARSLIRLLSKEGATHVAVAFDHVVESFRNELFAGYKTGDGIDPDLYAQFELAEQITAALGITIWPMVEFEADDALASAAEFYGEDPRVEQVLICSPDKDLMQCVSGSRIVAVDRRRDQTIDQQGVREKFGVEPESIPDWLALVGDKADGIPGIPRWGTRSASAALAAHHHWDQIPEDPSDWRFKVRGAASLAASLATHRDQLPLYRTLATLRRDVPLSETLEQLEWRGALRTRLDPLLEEFGDRSLSSNLPRRDTETWDKWDKGTG
jgi:5'-3' exonuclease